MKKLLSIVLFFPLTLLLADQKLPPKELRAEWDELKEIDIENLEIIDFHGWGIPFDGGSKVFFLEAKKNRFDIILANPTYWTEEDKEQNRQVIYLTVGENRMYLVEHKSREEKVLSKALLKASEKLRGKEKTDPSLLKKLSQIFESRKPLFNN